MGKIKSAIITALLCAAIVVLAVFAVFSWQVPGSNGIKKYNSFLSSVHLGGDLAGNAVAILYPDGVITAEEYELGKPERPTNEDELEKYEKELQNYVNEYVQHGKLYIEKELIEKHGESSTDVESLKQVVLKDAKVLSNRLDKKGYSAYSVTVADDFTVMVSVPADFTYNEYKNDDWTSSTRTDKTSVIERTIEYLAYNGELSLRNSAIGTPSYDNIVTNISVDTATYFKSIKKYSVAGNNAVRLNLTKEGRKEFKSITAKIVAVEETSADKAIGFYVGDYKLLSLTVNEEIDTRSFLITVPESSTSELDAQNYAIVLNSVVQGEAIELDYNSNDIQVVYVGAELGDTAAVFLFVAILLVMAGAIAYSIIRYKKLGLVQTIIILIFALALLIAIMLLEIEITLAGAVTAILGLALLCASNFALFESVRKETKKGKTIQSSVKDGYKDKLFGILEMHVIILIVSIFLAFVGVGEIATCGFVLFISTVASYVLYWFTRFMWYVISSLDKDKFKFCGFKREELEDD